MSDSINNPPAVGVKATFSLPIGPVFLEASAILPAGQTTLTELLPIVRNLEDIIVRKASQEASQAGTPVSCGPGCGACCRQLVPLSLFEAEALAEWLRSLPEEQRAALEEKFHRALLALRDAGILEKILKDDWAAGGEPAAELAIDYFHARVPCPFLENESCSIHPIRPLSCREYLVTSPPELCQDPAIHPVAGVQLPLKLSVALYRFGTQIARDPRGWIPLVFLPAWSRHNLHPGENVAGTGEEVLRAFLDQLMAAPPAGVTEEKPEPQRDEQIPNP